MNMNKLKYGTIGLAALLLAPMAHADIAVPIEGLDVNLIGIAVGSVPDYWGSKDQETVAGPYGRYQFEGSQRYIQVLGPEITFNLLNDANWRVGPIIRYRSARDNDVENNTVSQLKEVDSAIEGGVFVNYKLALSEEPLHQVTFGGDYESGRNGAEGHLKVNYFQPFSKTIIGNIGLGMTYGNDKFMESYFGVSGAQDVALYPSLGGQNYNASSGIVSWSVPFGVSAFLTKEWLLSVGGRYERLVGDAKDSPVVDQSGDANQWIGGLGLAYVFW
jgi:MipA family protein